MYIQLTDKESFEFESVLKKDKKSDLLRLWSNRKKKAGDLNKKQLFRQLFSKEYTKDEDVLLRNEWRLLKEELKNFLAKRHLERIREESQHTRDLLYLKEMFYREEWREFEADLKKIKKKLRDRSDEDVLFQVMELELRFLVNQSGQQPELMQKINALNDEMIALSSSINYRKRVYAESVKAWSIRILQIQNASDAPEYHFPSEWEQNNTDKDPEAAFYRLKIKSLYSGSPERLGILQKMEELALMIQRKSFPSGKELAVIYSNLGVEFSFIPDYPLSMQYFRKSVALHKHLPQVNFHQVLFNFISLLVKAMEIKEAMQLISIYGRDLMRDPFIGHRFRLINMMALVFSGKIPEAKKLFPEKIKEGHFETYVYYRVVEVILLFERDKTELAERFALNLQASLKGKQGLDHHRVFLKNFLVYVKKGGEMNKSGLMKLYTNSDPSGFLQMNVIPLNWLRGKIKKVLDKQLQ